MVFLDYPASTLMTVTNRPTVKKIVKFLFSSDEREATMPRKNSVGDGDSAAQKRALGTLPDAVRVTKKSSKQVASGTTAEKGAADKDKPTTNRNLAQGKENNSHVIL